MVARYVLRSIGTTVAAPVTPPGRRLKTQPSLIGRVSRPSSTALAGLTTRMLSKRLLAASRRVAAGNAKSKPFRAGVAERRINLFSSTIFSLSLLKNFGRSDAHASAVFRSVIHACDGRNDNNSRHRSSGWTPCSHPPAPRPVCCSWAGTRSIDPLTPMYPGKPIRLYAEYICVRVATGLRFWHGLRA